MKRISHIALVSLFSLATACSPACTPPEAKSPDAAAKTETQTSPNVQAASDKGGAAKVAPPYEVITEAPGVDLAALSEAQRAAFFNTINVEPSACQQAHSLATSLRDDAQCRNSLIVAQFIADRLGAGATPASLRDELEIVVDSLQQRAIQTIDRPVYGNTRAPVTVAVFADFECPHCRAEAPGLRQAVDKFRGQAKLVFKHFPLRMHERAKVAAVATEAAREQGKFWEMHDILFEHQDQLEDADIFRYAERVGLDVARFKASFQAQKGLARVEEDRAEGEKLGITGTPAVFVNGMYMNDLLFGGTVVGWIDEALKR